MSILVSLLAVAQVINAGLVSLLKSSTALLITHTNELQTRPTDAASALVPRAHCPGKAVFDGAEYSWTCHTGVTDGVSVGSSSQLGVHNCALACYENDSCIYAVYDHHTQNCEYLSSYGSTIPDQKLEFVRYVTQLYPG